jgi:hypothetical protein
MGQLTDRIALLAFLMKNNRNGAASVSNQAMASEARRAALVWRKLKDETGAQEI